MSTTRSARAIPRFLIPSLIGIFIFIVPVPDGEGSTTIPVAYLADAIQERLADAIPVITVAVIAVSVLGTGIHRFVRPQFMQNRLMRALFATSPVWFGIRILGLIFGLATLLQIGPEWLWGEATGQVIFDLAALMVTVFFLAGLLLPLLLNFGLLEFTGALMNKIMRPLFTVPGRSSIDSLASWLGDATIGVLMTSQQYEQGYYTRREAAVLGTTFNVVSLTFTIVIIGYLGLQEKFLAFYGTVVVAGLIAAMIMPRIPPLSRFSDDLAEGAAPQQTAQDDGPMLRRAWTGALARSASAKLSETAGRSAANVLEMWMGIIPVIMAVGTVAVVVAEQTPLFTWLGYPFVPLLELMQVPEAQAASETVLIGFTDMLLPALIATEIPVEMTRFIIGCLSVTQLIFMSEVGGMLLASRIPVTFRHLVMVFLLRTIITLPIIVGCAHLIY